MKKYMKIKNDVLKRMIKADFVGYDPAGFKYSRRAIKIRFLIDKLPIYFFRKIVNFLFSRTMNYLGEFSVYVLKPEKKHYTKGLALVLSGLSFENKLNYKLISYIIEKIKLLRLKDKFLWAHNDDYSFPCGTIVNTSTPNLVTTSFVANSFFDLFTVTQNKNYKDIFCNIVDQILTEISYKNVTKDKICFMYTPITNYHVHNANLLFAELLAKRFYLDVSEKKKSKLSNLIKKSINYSIGDFNETGTYPYAGPPTINKTIDNYHTGYVLRSLHGINQYLGFKHELSNKLNSEIERLLKFYIKNFIRNGLIVRDKTGSIQSHSLAESILIYKIFQDKLSLKNAHKFEKAIEATMTKMYYKKKITFLILHGKLDHYI